MDVKPDSEQIFTNQVTEAEPPTYVSPLAALLTGSKGAPKLIEIPPPSPAMQKRIRQMEERQEREVARARDRAYKEAPPELRPKRDADLSAAELGELNQLRAEWLAWHEEFADTWQPDGGELDVTDLVCIGPADLLPAQAGGEE